MNNGYSLSIKNDVIELLNEGGLFGTCSLTLLHGLNQFYPSLKLAKVEWNQHKCLKDGDENAYTNYFVQPVGLEGMNKFKPFNYNYTKYQELDFGNILPFVKAYFTPAKKVLALKEKLKKKYGIEPSRTLVVYYRGTDKGTEIPPLDPKLYVEEAKKILEADPKLDLWIQTDDYLSHIVMEESLTKDLKKFGRLVKVKELPMSTGNLGIHLSGRGNNVQFNETFLATVLLMAECRHLVIGCGNVPLWTVLFRGNAEGVTQLLPLVYSINFPFTQRFYAGGFKEQECEVCR